jgi:hypothetical protein
MNLNEKIEKFKDIVSEMGAYQLQLNAIKDNAEEKARVEAHINDLQYQSIHISLEITDALSSGEGILVEHRGDYYQVYDVSTETIEDKPYVVLKTFT